MKHHTSVIWGSESAEAAETAPGVRKGVDCSTRANKALHAGGLVPPPVAVPLPAPARDSVAGACALPGRLYQLPDDMAAASGFVVVNPETGERTGVLALRSLVESQVPLRSL